MSAFHVSSYLKEGCKKRLPCEAACPKCGSKDKMQKYLKQGQYFDKFTASNETLFTVCRNCRYNWEVKPLE